MFLKRSATCALTLLSLSTWSPSAGAQDNVKEKCVAAHSDAQTRRNQGKLRAARDALLLCARPECPAVARDDCTKWLGEVQDEIPSIVVVATDANGSDVADVKVLSDGVVVAPQLTGQPVLLDPGSHTLRFEREGANPVERKLMLRVGERNRRVEVQFSPQLAGPATEGPTSDTPPEPDVAPGAPIPVATWILAGVGVVGIASFAYFSLDGQSKVDDLEACKPNCPADDVDAARTSFLIGDISLGVGVAALVGATYFYLSSRGDGGDGKAPQSDGLRVDFRATAGGASGFLSGRF
jgi:hypothetical protein